jgi:hypothetical protein
MNIAAGAVKRGKYESVGMNAGKIKAEKLKDLKKNSIRSLNTGIAFYIEIGKLFKVLVE